VHVYVRFTKLVLSLRVTIYDFRQVTSPIMLNTHYEHKSTVHVHVNVWYCKMCIFVVLCVDETYYMREYSDAIKLLPSKLLFFLYMYVPLFFLNLYFIYLYRCYSYIFCFHFKGLPKRRIIHIASSFEGNRYFSSPNVKIHW
jgi:hypothetical protein